MISASLDAWLRPSRTSQPKTRIMIRYSRRTDTNRDLAATHTTGQTAAHGACIEFWSGTGRFAELMDKFMPDWRSRRDQLNAVPLADEQWNNSESSNG